MPEYQFPFGTRPTFRCENVGFINYAKSKQLSKEFLPKPTTRSPYPWYLDLYSKCGSPWECQFPGPSCWFDGNRYQPLPMLPVVPLPVFEKDPLIQVLHLHSVYSWTFQFGCLTWFCFRVSIHHPLRFKLAHLGRNCCRYFMLDILQTCLASDYDSWACILYHGNPKPSFLGVITHILGV